MPVLLVTASSFAAETRTDRSTSAVRSMVGEYCADCHDGETKKGGLDFGSISLDDVTQHPDTWETVVRKLRARQMPPAGKKRPEESAYVAVLSQLESSLDRAAAKHPNPGRTETFRRLNRTEYPNAIRDLLALDIDAAALLPKDEASHGFDNVTVGDLSPTLLDRYITAAQRSAARRIPGPFSRRYISHPTGRHPEEHMEGLPIGTRGGAILHLRATATTRFRSG